MATQRKKKQSTVKSKTLRRRPGPRSKPLVSSPPSADAHLIDGADLSGFRKPERSRTPKPIGIRSSMMEWNDETIRALREHLQLTQAQMAQELGTRQQTISEWEVGMYKPRGGMARLLTIVAERGNFTYQAKSDAAKD